MKITLLILFIVYILLTVYFFRKFFKNNKSLDETLESIKEDLSKIFPCCINKKNIEEKISKEKASELETEMEKITKDSDCKEPFGVPLDICLDGNLSKEEILMREKVIKILNRKDYKVTDGGKEKLVLPMEAVLFLTKNLNPLVTEDGDITIKINSIKEDSISKKEIDKLIIELKDKESVLYKDDEELIKRINQLIKHNNLNEIYPSEAIKETITVNEPEKPNFNEVQTINEPDEPNFNEVQTINEPDEPDFNNSKKETVTISSSPFDDNDETTFNELENDFGNDDLDLNDLLMQELENIELDDDDKDSNNDFYKTLKYKTVKDAAFDFDDIENSLSILFDKDEAYHALFKNIAKSEPIVYNGSKTVCLVDQNIVLFAIAKMFGMEYKNIIEEFKKLKKDKLIKINNILTDKLDIYLSDLLSGNRKPNFYLLKDKENNKYFSFAFVFQTNAFKTSLNNEEFDFFRSFPYNNEYTFVKKATKEESTNSIKLVMDMKDVEIK